MALNTLKGIAGTAEFVVAVTAIVQFVFAACSPDTVRMVL